MMKVFLLKLQESFKSLGIVSQLGIALGMSLAILAGVYGISQAMSPMPKVTQVVEVQTSNVATSSSPSSAEKKETTNEKKEENTTARSTEETITTEEQKTVVEGSTTQEALPSRDAAQQEPLIAIIAQDSEITSNNIANPETPSASSVDDTTVQTQEAYRLKPLGNTGVEFASFELASEWMRAKLDQSAKAYAAGKQDWVYTGRAYEVPWSDGHKTVTVDLTEMKVQPRAVDTTTDTSSQTDINGTGNDHL